MTASESSELTLSTLRRHLLLGPIFRKAAAQPRRACRSSERRAAAVAAFLAAKGVPKDKIETLGMGKTQPVPGVVCEQKNRKALIVCLQPHRRVEVEVKGEIVIRR